MDTNNIGSHAPAFSEVIAILNGLTELYIFNNNMRVDIEVAFIRNVVHLPNLTLHSSISEAIFNQAKQEYLSAKQYIQEELGQYMLQDLGEIVIEFLGSFVVDNLDAADAFSSAVTIAEESYEMVAAREEQCLSGLCNVKLCCNMC